MSIFSPRGRLYDGFYMRAHNWPHRMSNDHLIKLRADLVQAFDFCVQNVIQVFGNCTKRAPTLGVHLSCWRCTQTFHLASHALVHDEQKLINIMLLQKLCRASNDSCNTFFLRAATRLTLVGLENILQSQYGIDFSLLLQLLEPFQYALEFILVALGFSSLATMSPFISGSNTCLPGNGT